MTTTAPLRGMLYTENDDLIGSFVDRVVDEIGIFARDKLAYALRLLEAAHMGKDNEVLEALS